MSDRKKLETTIEREVFKLIGHLKDHSRDFTVLKMRRQGGDYDHETMARVLDTVDQAIIDGFHVNIDRFMKGLDKSLGEFSDEENPLPHSEE